MAGACAVFRFLPAVKTEGHLQVQSITLAVEVDVRSSLGEALVIRHQEVVARKDQEAEVKEVRPTKPERPDADGLLLPD